MDLSVRRGKETQTYDRSTVKSTFILYFSNEMYNVTITYNVKSHRTEIMIGKDGLQGKEKFVPKEKRKMTAPDYFPIYRVAVFG